jgi:uncharacterized protein
MPAITAVDRDGADPVVVERAVRRLKAFADGLPPNQRAALRALVRPGGGRSALAVLGAEPAAAVLEPREAELLRRLPGEESRSHTATGPSLVMIMKATRLCNMRCAYCNQWRDGPNQNMRFEVLARAIHGALQLPDIRRVEFVWHGGEPTLLPMSFFRKALWLQQRFRRPGQVVHNAIQTNALRLPDEWIAFLRRNEFSVGVSLDGPPEVHDRRRLDVASRPTSERVRSGLGQLAAAGIRHGVLVVVDDAIVDFGAGPLLDYLQSIGVEHVDLLNALPKNTAVGAPLEGFYIDLDRYVEFLRDVFRLWWPARAERISIRELGGLVQQLRGGGPGTCVFAGNCFGSFLTVDPGGDVSACDKYVGDPQYVFGSLMRADLSAILSSARLENVRRENERELAVPPACRWFTVCHGACPHDRYTARRRRPERAEGCCGFAPLLSDIEEAVMSG